MRRRFVREAIIACVGAILFFVSTRAVHQHFDYTERIALAFLVGHAGLDKPPPSWLSEMVPFGDRYYSVFPLGAVLSQLPTALLQKSGLVQNWPAHLLVAVLAAGCIYFFLGLTYVREMTFGRRVLLAFFPIFASWTWTNLGFAGAWQIALGFALLGETAALYFILVRPAPLAAGACFALAFGNRTELLLTLPAYLFLLNENRNTQKVRELRFRLTRAQLASSGRFLLFPTLLLLSTALYNWVRFRSVTDFGNSGISIMPGTASRGIPGNGVRGSVA